MSSSNDHLLLPALWRAGYVCMRSVLQCLGCDAQGMRHMHVILLGFGLEI